MVPEKTQIAVLGGGVCGLYAARKTAQAGIPVTVLEKAPDPGGLAAGHRRGANYYDLGVHMLHAFDREIYEDIRAIMGGKMLDVQLVAKIRYGRGFCRYPLQFVDLLQGIPLLTLVQALVGLISQQLVNAMRKTGAENAEQALIQLYGRPLYEFFFRDFTTRYWGIPPARLSAAFVRRKMPRLSAVDILKKAIGLLGVRESKDAAVESALREETEHYSEKGAYQMPWSIVEAIRADGGVVHLNSEVLNLETTDRRVTAVRYTRDGQSRRLECDYCISTVPLPVLMREMQPAPPPRVVEACSRLHYKPIAIFGLLVRKPRVLDAMYVYYRDRIFHRVGEPKSCGLKVTPPDHTVLIVETTCEIGDDKWNNGEETRRRIIHDLEAEQLLHAADIVEIHHISTPHGYPVFHLGFEPHLKTVQDYIAEFPNLVSTGRNGGFSYPNMHSAMRMGADAAAAFIARIKQAASR